MPYVKSLREVVIDTLHGHTIRVPAKTAKYIPDIALERALEKGCIECDEKGNLLIDEALMEPKLPVDDIPKLTPEEREDPEKRLSILVMAIGKLYNEGATENFTASNTPKVKAVEQLVGFPTSGAEVARALDVYHANV